MFLHFSFIFVEMKIVAVIFSFFLFWTALLPCTDKIMDSHEHLPNITDVADTTGESPFHEDTCPLFCSCGCCATFTIAIEPAYLVFRIPVIPQSKPLIYPELSEIKIASAWWHPPRLEA
ncbi:MAG: hypothetical protein LPK09_12525 [Hymenobacteraceae bacterium]|nr:hypothetical protein [Hymenobacteraceae bacterium]